MADEYTDKLEAAVRAIVEAIRAPRPVNLNIATPDKRDYAAEAYDRDVREAAGAKPAERQYGILARDEYLRFIAAGYQVDPNGGLYLPGICLLYTSPSPRDRG